MSKKILFFETINLTPHLETSFELVINHLKKGDKVVYYFIGQAPEYNDYIIRDWTGWFNKYLPERRLAKLVKHPNLQIRFLLPKDLPSTDIEIPIFNDHDDLKRFTFSSYLVGLSALSSLISLKKTSNVDLAKNKKLLEKMIRSGISVYLFCKSEIDSKNPDLVYLFNGRFVLNRAILDACKATKTKFLIHERGSNMHKYVVRSFMPHNFEKINSEILYYWKGRSQEANKIATEFFENRRIGKQQNWISFVKDQKRNFINVKKTSGKKLITYFSSSEDEFASVGDMVKWKYWPNQFSAVKDLIDIVNQNQKLELVIRIHPHLILKDKNEIIAWVALGKNKNVKIILPNDKTDSYQLIEISDIVVTSGSTVGIEAVYFNTPSVCLGPNLYSQLNAVYIPTNKDKLEKLLNHKELSVKREKAFPYGYYFETFGKEFKYYQPESLFKGTFVYSGKKASGNNYVLRVLNKLYSLTKPK